MQHLVSQKGGGVYLWGGGHQVPPAWLGGVPARQGVPPLGWAPCQGAVVQNGPKGLVAP